VALAFGHDHRTPPAGDHRPPHPPRRVALISDALAQVDIADDKLDDFARRFSQALLAPASAAAEPEVQVPSYVAAEQRAAAWMPEPLPVPLPALRRAPALAATMLGGDLPTSAVMPFEAPSEAALEAYARRVDHAQAAQRPAGARRSAVGSGTVPLPDDAPCAPGSGTVPLPGSVAVVPLPADVADLTVVQYASLCVELDRRPDSAAATLHRYGVPAARRAALEAHWKERFLGDPGLEMTHARACAAYAAWLAANPAPSRG
jgi:hypothetical protein